MRWSWCLLLLVPTVAQAAFLEDFPGLRQYLFSEPESPMKLGMSFTPVGITKNKTYFGASLFQFHYMSEWIDWEIAGVGIGMSSARNKVAETREFTVRTVPKIRVLDNMSFGLLGGYELVSFPNVKSRMRKNNFATPEESFSSRGWIYGAAMAISFKSESVIFRVSPSYWIQTYPHEKIADDWKYYFLNPELQAATEREQLKADSVLAIELGILI